MAPNWQIPHPPLLLLSFQHACLYSTKEEKTEDRSTKVEMNVFDIELIFKIEVAGCCSF